MSLNLMMHCGGQEVGPDQLDVELPPATGTFTPVPHVALVDEVRRSLSGHGHEVIGEAHGLSSDGQRYFGVMEIAPEERNNNGDTGLVVGLRNSHDKSFAAQLALGHGVFVCDNLAFSGEVRIARRHTRHVRRDLPEVTARAIGKLMQFRQRQESLIEEYKRRSVPGRVACELLVRAMEAKAIGCTHIPKVLAEWRRPRHEEFQPRNAWSMFNAFTEVLKGSSLTASMTKTTRLHGVFNRTLAITV